MTEPIGRHAAVTQEQLEELKATVQDNANAIANSIRSGNWDWALPGLSGTQTPEEVKGDARDRAWRTMWQQFLIDLVGTVAIVVGPAVLNANLGEKAQLLAIGALILKTGLSVIVSYILRLKVAPSDSQVNLKEAQEAQDAVTDGR